MDPDTPDRVSGQQNAWHLEETQVVLAELGVAVEQGLGAAEVADRLRRDGPNELAERGVKTPARIFWEQLTGTLVLVLIVAAVVSALIGDAKDAIAIVAIVVLNAILGFVQENRAERALAALRRLAVPQVRVRRDGEVREVSARELVAGDIVLLEAGNLVPADGRLVDVVNLRIEEAVLTGESEAVTKTAAVLAASGGGEVTLGDRTNMAFMGTTVGYGRGEMAVTATGMRTELGRVADLFQEVEAIPTPLQLRLNRLGRSVAIIAAALVVILFGVGIALGEDWKLMIMTAIGVAVAVVPEGLPAVVTIALALGARRMLGRQALIRKLSAVEALGSVTTICSDKTGTLTENRMTVTVLDFAGHRLELTEEFRHREPVILGGEDRGGEPGEHPALALLLAGGALCNDATLQPDGAHPGRFRALGDPTEGALLVAAARHGWWKPKLEETLPRVVEIPFDSERKRMTTVHRVLPGTERLAGFGALAGPYVAFTKGSVDGLLGCAASVLSERGMEPLDDGWRLRITQANELLAGRGMRVLGVAFRPLEHEAVFGGAEPETGATGHSFGAPDSGPARLAEQQERLERDLAFLGLVGMIDPPRPEVKAAVAACRTAGIRPVMITGDHPLTAGQIARDLGISDGGRSLTGLELSRLSAAELEQVVEGVSVFARVSPEHKLGIVTALQKRGQVVAMTGDGVNDAPALRRADIGVAMGITGSDVSKEAAAVVLLDDNFTTIVAAVEEGRSIYDNIRKFVKFSLSGNLGKVLTVFLAPLLGLPLPFTPFQLLWLNLVTDGALGLGMSVEPAERGTMLRPPHRPTESIFARGLGAQVVWMGTLIGLLVLGIAVWGFRGGTPAWQTMAVTGVVFAQAFQALAIRSDTESLFRQGLLSNRPLAGSIAAVVALQLAVVYLPPLQSVFGTVALSPGQLAVTALAGSVTLWAAEISKLLRRR